ncbi:arylamine N-acetyltransferase family protein [Raoultibacter phocaeensis]|uniref:arylamine N-acetyltransferase family protein n=1 Tax=Raoultibacter phocaeensis TaxID=2479841 RepID=UPI0015D61271|nr:arylamine N-acetyltransferase [Raoultibacter phocaeensis]
MFEELYEPLPDPARYWRRLGLDPADVPLTRDGLDRIIFAHQCAIPFENLDACEYHVPISLGIADMFEKIVAGKRGGYCFELNALFAALLADAGFSVSPCFARSLKDRGYVQPVAHRGAIVTIGDEKLFCDVGYGGPMPSCALPLKDGLEASSTGQTFRIERMEGPWWRILYCGREHAPRASAEPVLAFMDIEQYEVDFVALSLYCSTHPSSIFTQQRMLNRKTGDGSVSITADQFIRTTREDKEQRTIETDEEFRRLAKTHFGIELPTRN